MKKILSFTLALGLISPLYADNTKRQAIESYIKDIERVLDISENYAMTYMSENSRKFSNISPDQRKKINDEIKAKYINVLDHNGPRFLLSKFKNQLKNINNSDLEKFDKDLRQYNETRFVPFTQAIREKIRSTLEVITIPHCPKTSLTSQEWTDLKNNGHATLVIEEKEYGFYVMEEDKNNFPNAAQLKTWNDLMKSLPYKEAIDMKSVFDHKKTVTCHYKYRSTLTRKDYIIRIWSKF